MTNAYPVKTVEREDVEYPAMLSAGYYLLMDEISPETVAPVIKWVLEENFSKKKKKALNLVISSGGGNLEAAFALVDIIKGSTIPVHTTGIGIVGSAALVIFLSGTTRTLTPNTSVLSHQFSWESEGKVHELFATMKEFTLSQQKMIQHYCKCTGLTEEQVQQYLLPSSDVWLSADEAKTLNICSTVKQLY